MFSGVSTLPKHEIVNCGALYEVTFFCISPRNLLGDFFYSLNVAGHQEPDCRAIRCNRSLALYVLDFNPSDYI